MIFLSVLKIIGIVLACIVGFVLLLVLLVLFTPIPYKMNADGENTDMVITGSAKWLFGLANVKFAFVNFKFGYKLKIAGIKILMGIFPDSTKKKIEEKTEKELPSLTPVDDSDNFNVEQEKTDIPEIEYINIHEAKKDSVEKSEKENKEKADFQNKIKPWIEKYKKIKTLFESKETKKTVKFIKIQLFNILNHIKPKKISGNLNFGLEDPSNTAIIYGLIGSVMDIISNNKCIVTPEFYQKGVSCDLSINGSIFIGYVVICILRLLMDKNVKRLFRTVRRII